MNEDSGLSLTDLYVLVEVRSVKPGWLRCHMAIKDPSDGFTLVANLGGTGLRPT